MPRVGAVCHTTAQGVCVRCDIGKAGATDYACVLTDCDGKDAFPADVGDRIGDFAVAGSQRISLKQIKGIGKRTISCFIESPFLSGNH